jgi:hypothetical protein
MLGSAVPEIMAREVRPMISSSRAAAKTVLPTWLFKCPISLRVATVMLTEDAKTGFLECEWLKGLYE